MEEKIGEVDSLQVIGEEINEEEEKRRKLEEEEQIKQLQQMYIKAHTPWRKRYDIGRNDPCPCGSGKKYKNCCIGKVDEEYTINY